VSVISGALLKKAFTEEDPPGIDFLAQVCQAWEANADLSQKKSGILTVKLRTGAALSGKGGALQSMEKNYKILSGCSARKWESIHVFFLLYFIGKNADTIPESMLKACIK